MMISCSEGAIPSAVSPDSLTVGTEKVLLGTLIEYPTLLDLYLERLMAIEFSSKLESFKREIYRIVNEFRDVSVTTFYREIKDEFVSILEDVYGRVDAKSNKVMATNLYRRFPLLKWDPPLEFVDRAVLFFFDRLDLRQVERELKEGYSNSAKMSDETELERITNLARYVVEQGEKIAAQDRVLAEDASQIRRQLGTNLEPWALVAA